MKVEIKLVGDICLNFDLSPVRYRVKNNILAERIRKPLILKSDLMTLDTVILPTKYTKFIEVYTAEGKEVTIDKEFPTRLSGDFKFVIKKKTIDIKKTVIFKQAYKAKMNVKDELLLENLEISSNSLFRTRDLRNLLTSEQNIIHFGSTLQFEVMQSKRVEIDIQDLIILEALLSKNIMRYSKYILIEITKTNAELFLGPNQKYISKLLTNISKRLTVYIYTDLSEEECKNFASYEKIATAVMYEEIDLMQAYVELKTKTLKIDAKKIKDYQLEYTLNDLSKRNIITSCSNGITIVVDNFEQLIHAIIENLNNCLSRSMYLNLETKFELNIEQQNIIAAFGCQNILLNSNVKFENKELRDNVDIVLVNNYPKYTNTDNSLILDYLNADNSNQTVFLMVNPIVPVTCVVDGYLVVKMKPQHLALVADAYDSIEVIGHNNDLFDFLYNINASICYNIPNISELSEQKLDEFMRKMWKIIGMPNLQFNFLNVEDFQIFNQRVNTNQIALKYSILDVIQESKGKNYFEIDNEQLPIVVKHPCDKVKILEDIAMLITYHNDLSVNTVEVIFEGESLSISNRKLLYLPAGSILDCKGTTVSIYVTGNQYNPNEFKKYRNEMIVNSSLSGEYIEDPNFGLEDYYINYAGIFISPSNTGQMFVTNICLENKDKLNKLYLEMLKSDKLMYMVLDEQSNLTNIITTYNVISNLKLSVLATQDEVYQKIKQNNLWELVEVVR